MPSTLRTDAYQPLATRILTAAVLVPLVVLGALFLPSAGVAAVLAVLLLAGAWEWAALLGDPLTIRRCFVGGLAAAAALAIAAAEIDALAPLAVLFIALALAASAVSWIIIASPRAVVVDRLLAPVGGHLLAAAALVGATASMAWVASGPTGSGWVLTFLFTIWAVDTAGYAAGRLIGRRKLAPAISPAKTQAGAVAGVVAGLAVAALAAAGMGLPPGRALGLMVLGGWVAAVSIIGDLTLSLIKRRAGVKDTGTLFPGHGGVLDRMDGLIAALPWFALGAVWLD